MAQVMYHALSSLNFLFSRIGSLQAWQSLLSRYSLKTLHRVARVTCVLLSIPAAMQSKTAQALATMNSRAVILQPRGVAKRVEDSDETPSVALDADYRQRSSIFS